MSLKTDTIVEHLYHVSGKAEIVDGEILPMSPTGGIPGHVSAKIWLRLYEYQQHTRTGQAVNDNVGFIVDLPHRTSFSPDAAFVIGQRPSMRFYEGAPVFAVEVRSEGDYGPAPERAMVEKRADYFAAGTLVVWDVDVLSEDVVRVYRVDTPNTPTIYRHGETAEAEPAVPGWTMLVDDLFD